MKGTYVDEYDLWLGILSDIEFAICFTKNELKLYTMGQLILICNMISPIKHKTHWKLVCQKKEAKINKDKICENKKNKLRLGIC